MAESDLPLKLSDVAHSALTGDVNEREVLAFLRERLHFYLKDVRGFAYDVVNAVLAADADDVRDAIARAEALTAARASADFEAVSAAFKRINNILRQAAEKGFAVGSPDRGDAFTRSCEIAAMRRRRWLPRWRSCGRIARTVRHWQRLQRCGQWWMRSSIR